MPRISADNKQFYKARIRSLLVQHPFMAQRELQETLAAEGLQLDRKYLGSLLNAIYAERTKRADTWTLNMALAAFQDAMSEIVRIAMEVATDPRQPGRDRAAALREAREAYNLSFEKLFDAGVFERKLGTIEEVVRNTPLDDDRKQAIRSVLENWGLILPPTVSVFCTDINCPERTGGKCTATLSEDEVREFEAMKTAALAAETEAPKQ